MSHFMCLTDIVKCNLTEILNEADDPIATLQEIISEMELGLAGTRRTVDAAARNEGRLRDERDLHRAQIEKWTLRAKDHLAQGDDDAARKSLMRKREHEDLIVVLERDLQSAANNRDQFHRTLRALEARLADARRRYFEMTSPDEAASADPDALTQSETAVEPERIDEIEAELNALKRELGQS